MCGNSKELDEMHDYLSRHYIDSSCTKNPKFEQCTTTECNVAATPLSCWVGNELSATGISYYLKSTGSCDAQTEAGAKAQTDCDFADDECWSFRLNDNTIYECGYSGNRANATLRANLEMFIDSDCTKESKLDYCTTADCNTFVAPLYCNVG